MTSIVKPEDLHHRDPENIKDTPEFPIHPQVKYLLSLPYYVQRSDSWFEQRKNRLTASDLDTVLGRSKYNEPIEVLFKKNGIAAEFKGNEATAHGQKYEDDAIALYCYFHKKKNFSFGLLPHPTVQFLAGSPDDVTHDGVVIEVKCPFSRKIVHGEIPHHYRSQVNINMEVCQLDDAAFIEYKPSPRAMEEGTTFKDVHDPHSGEYELNIVHVKRDPEWFPSIYPKLKKAWDEILHYRKVGIHTHPYYEYMVRKTRKPKKLSLLTKFIVDEEDEEFENPESERPKKLSESKKQKIKQDEPCIIMDESDDE